MKKSLIIIALALLACLVVLVVVVVVLRSRPHEPDETVAARVSETSRTPTFEVRVIMPRLGLPLGGILPDALVKKLDATPSEMRFDDASPGVRIGSVEPDHLELSADGWDLSIEADSQGHINPGTRLVFNLGLGGNKVKLRCRPADRRNGYLSATQRAGSDELGGRFLVELATCEDAESGKAIEWPPAPLTVRGSFDGLRQRRR